MRMWTTIAAVALLAASAAGAGTGTITVVVSGIENAKGTVLVQLANSKADYESDDDAFRFAKVKATGGPAEVVFADVPYGEYAVKAFHDENDNLKIDIGWRGPTERYGFSNGARGTFGPPGFDAAKFRLDAPALELKIALE